MVSMVLRFVPTLLQELDQIKEAQMARGADFKTGTILARMKRYQMNSLLLLSGEEVILRGQGSYDGGSLSSSWKLGNLYLTNKRLLFAQARRAIFAVALEEIREVKVEPRRWLLGRKVKQLCLLTRGGRVFIAIKDAQLWEELIKDGIIISPVHTRGTG